MSGIAGIAAHGEKQLVEKMLSKISYRGFAGCNITENQTATLGVNWSPIETDTPRLLKNKSLVSDGPGNGHTARACLTPDGIVLERDPLGVVPLYYGYDLQGRLCFASEVKALLEVTRHIYELAPGHRYDGQKQQAYFKLHQRSHLHRASQEIASELRHRLEKAIEVRITDDYAGSWLSGGLDSSTMAALARQYVTHLYTFAAGLEGAPDLEFARQVARHIGSEHHEVIVSLDDLLTALPEVIYHLESFDALLVRSSITNYLVARLASDYVSLVFSGEGGDELFAGYAYLKRLEPSTLDDELLHITQSLHNTALQRVDRCAAAHGTMALVGFLDPQVVDYAFRIPVSLKMHHGTEKWILRQAVTNLLPPSVVKRPKAKFWQGSGLGDLLSYYADETISDQAFTRERSLPNGWRLNTKEELMYYRIFRDHFGQFDDLAWMGRTKRAPVH
jgi:asparagine synthase (glutamine-hydrolysing)